jgi:hypothetical protein
MLALFVFTYLSIFSLRHLPSCFNASLRLCFILGLRYSFRSIIMSLMAHCTHKNDTKCIKEAETHRKGVYLNSMIKHVYLKLTREILVHRDKKRTD